MQGSTQERAKNKIRCTPKKTDCNALAHPLIVFRTTLNLRPMHTFKKTYCDIHSYETLEAEPQEARGKQEEKAKTATTNQETGGRGYRPFFPLTFSLYTTHF